MPNHSRAQALAFLTAFVTLCTQILVHRVISAKLLNNYAFLVISLTMLGFAFSGVLLSRLLSRALAHLDDFISSCAALFGLTMLTATAVFYRLDIGSQSAGSRHDFVLALLTWMPVSLIYAVPYVLAGLILGALLSDPRLPTRRIYFIDLVGSALGAVAVIPAINFLGVEHAIILACASLLLPTIVLFPPSRPIARLLAASGIAALTAALLFAPTVFHMVYPKGSLLANTQEPGSRFRIEHIDWDALARIEVSRIPPPSPGRSLYPSLLGENPAFFSRFRYIITQNNYAFTYAPAYDGTRETLAGLEETMYAAAYRATSVSHPAALTIGVGGGIDVLAALAHDASSVTGVEINRATVNVLTHTFREYFAPWLNDPRVQIVQDDGRHFLHQTDRRFDVIQISEVGAYSGTPGVAHVFTENHLYTIEAFRLYLDHLTDQGVLNVMRLELLQPRIVLRALTTAMEALRRNGAADPGRHIMVLTQQNGRFSALLVKKTPFTTEEQTRLSTWAGQQRFFGVSAAPYLNAQQANLYQIFLSLNGPDEQAVLLRRYPLDVSPIDDDRPFFFRFSYWSHLVSDNPIVLKHSIPIMEYSVLMLLAVVGSAAVLCIYLPLRFLVAEPGGVPHRFGYAVYFAGTGLGYMALEIGLMQKFGLFLGHPNYSLSIVLATLLFATGLGALFSARLAGSVRRLRVVGYTLVLLILVDYAVIMPRLAGWAGISWWMKAAVVTALIVPIGICLGVFLPFALDRLKMVAPAHAPWAWGINGIFSVLGPILAMALAMTWGINALLLSSIPIYLGVAFSLSDPTGCSKRPSSEAEAKKAPEA